MPRSGGSTKTTGKAPFDTGCDLFVRMIAMNTSAIGVQRWWRILSKQTMVGRGMPEFLNDRSIPIIMFVTVISTDKK